MDPIRTKENEGHAQRHNIMIENPKKLLPLMPRGSNQNNTVGPVSIIL